jgi:adenylylsulfate kinase
VLVVLTGLPGVGKTTLARALSKRLPAFVLNKDEIRDAIFPPAALDYSSAQNELSTRVLLMVAEYILRRDPDRTVIIDGKPFSREEQIREVVALGERSGHEVRVIHCVAPDDVVARRLAADAARDPKNMEAGRTYEKYRDIKGSFETITVPHRIVDTANNLDAVVEEALQYLGTEDRGQRAARCARPSPDDNSRKA